MRIGHIGQVGSIALWSVPSVFSDISAARREGKSTVWAGTKSAVKNNALNIALLGVSRPMLAFAGIMALQVGGALIGPSVQMFRNTQQNFRLASTPFSQRFELSDMAQAHQQYGLNSISGTHSRLGNEASAFASRYNRR
jgi:hypothetical protein